MKTIEQQFVVLDEIDHVRHRLSMYAGSPILAEEILYTYDKSSNKMIKSSVSKIPAVIKVISEVIDNAIDEYKRKPGKITQLKIFIDKSKNEIMIEDNGGIPVEIHKEFNKYVPEIIFGQLRSGSNYSDEEDQALAGVNGLGSKLTNICSTSFIVETSDGKNYFKQEFKNGLREKSEPFIKPSNKNFTRITFSLDLAYFKLAELDDNHIKIIHKRAIDAAGINSGLKVYLSEDEKFVFKDIEDYFGLYSDTVILESDKDWVVGVGTATDGFEQVSFVNGLETYEGGTHVSYVSDQIVNKIREFVKKKHKIDCKPSDIRNQLNVYISCNINRPKFNSQSKTFLVSDVKDYKTSWTASDKFINKILKSEIVQKLMDWVMARQKAEELAELRKLNKDIDKASFKSVDKFRDANEKVNRKDCILLLTEGDSAAAPILDVRDPKLIGVFPLKGRVMNVSAAELSDAKDNKELVNICKIMGLKFGETVKSLDDLRFGKILIATDADEFGNAIAAQLMNTFYRFWPELYKFGCVNKLITPVIKIKEKSKTQYFYSEKDYNEWLSENPNSKASYTFLKGLGSSSQEDFDYYLNKETKLHTLSFDDLEKSDKDTFDLCFLKGPGSADKRKEWLDIL